MTKEAGGTKDEGRLSRWSRLKREARETGQETASVAPAAGLPAEAEKTAPVAPEDLPDIETLDAGSDYSAFLRDGVPENLKNLALRKLWRSDPVFANLDGLNDYDQNFSIIETIDAAVQTAYKVGRGLFDEEEKKAVATEAASSESAGEPAAKIETEAGGEEAVPVDKTKTPTRSEDV